MSTHARISKAQVVSFLNQFEKAQSTQSFDNVMDKIHPDALFRFNDGDYRGLDAIQGAFERTWDYAVQDERYYLTDIEVMHVDSNSATATFTFHWSGVGPQGPFHNIGRGTTVLIRHEGELKILIEHRGGLRGKHDAHEK